MDIKKVLKMKNGTYDKLKFVAQIALPAFGTFCAALGEIWSIPYMGAVVATILAFDVFLGGILGISTKIYNEEN